MEPYDISTLLTANIIFHLRIMVVPLPLGTSTIPEPDKMCHEGTYARILILRGLQARLVE